MTIDEVIDRWSGLPGGAERKNFAPFIYDLIDALDLPRPGPGEAGKLGTYEFEGTVQGGSAKQTGAGGSADLYKRGHFIMEAKQSWLPPRGERSAGLFDDAPVIPLSPSGAAYDKLMIRAQAQAKNYAAHLPGDHPPAPFLLVCDIGRAFEIFYDAAGNGRGYGFYPDAAGYRVPLARLREPAVQALFRDIWTNPAARDPSRQRAEVTRKVAGDLAEVSKFLERQARREIESRGGDQLAIDIAAEESSLFLMRMLFCMFAEDIGLLPGESFTDFLKSCVKDPHGQTTVDFNYLQLGLEELWRKMDSPGTDRRLLMLRGDVRYFNGRLFENAQVLRLGTNDVTKLIDAAERRWEQVEPAIFGTLLEQALSDRDRARLGAHYTPRAYVERLVGATVMEVLNAEWADVQDQLTDPATDAAAARAVAAAFQDRLARVTVLDPACGTGNFLYVAMEAIERLEAQVIEVRRQLGDTARARVAPHQFLGLEKNPRAAKIAELVLWIGWLRFRIGNDPDSIVDPVLGSAANINFGRAGAYDAVLDEATGLVPAWPAAEFIVGNPPFIGGQDLRARLGGDYAEALWRANPRVPKSADFVMQWWDRAADLLTAPGSTLKRFGFVTTNSITQTFSRRVIEGYLAAGDPPRNGEGDRRAQPGGGGAAQPDVDLPAKAPPPPLRGGPPPQQAGEDRRALSLVFAIPDHPWTKASPDAAAVRIAMTVAAAGARPGVLLKVVGEAALDSDAPTIEVREERGSINADLTVGANVTAARALRANQGIAHDGVKLHGKGFSVLRKDLPLLGLGKRDGLERFVRPYRNGKDLTSRTPDAVRDKLVVDLYPLMEREVRTRFPEAYQYLLERVRPPRALQFAKSPTNDARTYLEVFWLFGKPRPEARDALKTLKRYIGTVDTAKYRTFQFISEETLVDDGVVIIASDEAYILGVAQSALHEAWSLAASGTLEDRPRYFKTKSFDPFPFPDPSPAQRTLIAELAEELDASRKRALAEVPRLTVTELYNLRAAWVAGTLTPAQRERAVAAGAGIVARLHEELDAAVAAAYGWADDWRAGPLPPAEIVARLLALNAERAAEEAAGQVRWLRPDYQRPRFGRAGDAG